jgi:hypothetical protein
MSAFRDDKHVSDVLGGFFRERALSEDPVFTQSGAIIAYTTKEPHVRIVLDASKTPKPGTFFTVYVNDANAPAPNVELFMRADTLDALLRGDMKPMELVAQGRAKAEGDLSLAMRLMPAMVRNIPIYRKFRETH